MPVATAPQPARPMVPVAVEGGSPIGPAEDPPPPSWPHWRELLDGPRPDAARLRRAPGATGSRLRSRLDGTDSTDWLVEVGPGTERSEGATTRSPEPVPWPAADMAARRGDPDAG